MTLSSRALVEVHVATLLYGFIGPFGKAVALNPHQIVFWRTSLAALVLLAIARRLKSHTLVKTWADLATFTAIAGLLAVHWVLFFKSIKVSTVAIGLVTTYTYPVLMVFLESWFFNLRLKALDFASAVAVLAGIYYLAPEFNLSDATFQGVIYGVTAGAMIPFIVLIRKKRVIDNYNSWDISAYEMGIAGLLLLPFMLYDGSLFHIPSSRDILLLVMLGVVLTGFARVLFVNSQRHLSGKVVGITLVLEVVYGVILALILLAAVPSKREIIGGLIIVSAALFESLRSRKPETSGTEV
ncbi:MAG: EamA family transporter [Chloroflexi bacterium]|nr:EamA family transporter [Chloroflexota bacterium]